MFHQHSLRRLSRSEKDETYINPVIPGFNPDPSIIRVRKDYFLTTSTFEYFPGAPIYHSRDLIQWDLIGHALTRKSQLDIKAPEPGGGVWAVTLRYHDEWFYITTCSFDRHRTETGDRIWPRGFYVRTKDIWNSDSWSDPVYFDQPGFDQDLFWDDDGKVYLSTTYRKVDRDPSSDLKDFAVFISTVNLETGKSTSTPKLVRESKTGIAEGSHIFKRGQYYYLFTAEGGTEGGHSEWVFRSKEGPFGPWEPGPKNPLINNSTNDEVQNTGHCDLVEDDEGRWWAVCLAVRPTLVEDKWERSVFGKFVTFSEDCGLTIIGRETFLLPVSWPEDDWPTFNRGNPVNLLTSARGTYIFTPSHHWSDDFGRPQLQLGWYRKNTPPQPSSDYSLTENPGHLRLFGGAYSLSSPASPTLFLRKQKRRHGIWRTRLSFQVYSVKHEAGTVVYWNYFTWSSIGIRASQDGGRVIKYTPAEGKPVEIALKSAEKDVVLAIQCLDNSYKLGFEELTEKAKGGSSKDGMQWVGEVSNRVMTKDPPEGLPFTGMMFGLYAFGEMEPVLTPADFAFAEFMV